MRLMMEGIQAFGMQAAAGAVVRLEAIRAPVAHVSGLRERVGHQSNGLIRCL